MGELSCNVLFEDKYSAARALKFMSTELPTPPPEELIRNHPNESDEMYEPPDLGNMGWRLCKQPIRKVRYCQMSLHFIDRFAAVALTRL